MSEKVIGIAGGMGPEATLDLFKKIIKMTPATCDQEHLRVIIDNNPKIKKKKKAIFEGGEDPTSALVETARNLEHSGAQLLLIACNAAHYYYREITNGVSIPVLNIMDETAAYCRRKYPSISSFGLLAGSSTVELGLYAKAFERIQRVVVAPKGKEQKKVLRCIYKIKAGDLGPAVKTELLGIVENLSHNGAEAVILGCTEIPLVLEDGDHSLPLIDATQVLAKAGIAMARGEI